MTTDQTENRDHNSTIPPIDQKLLWDETARGIANTLAHVRTAWYGDEAIFYQRERERLAPRYLPPFYYGMAATAFLFINFRVTGHPLFKKWRTRFWQHLSPYRSTSKVEARGPPTTAQSAAAPPMVGYLETKRNTEIQKTLESMKLLTDLLVSISVGVSGTIFILEGKRQYMRKDFEEAPLVPGRSLVAEQCCPEFLKLVSKEQQDAPETQYMKQNDRNFATILTFIENCRKRSDYERRIRQERRLQDDAPVVVPYSGL
jgi:hypothetical protein